MANTQYQMAFDDLFGESVFLADDQLKARFRDTSGMQRLGDLLSELYRGAYTNLDVDGLHAIFVPCEERRTFTSITYAAMLAVPENGHPAFAMDNDLCLLAYADLAEWLVVLSFYQKWNATEDDLVHVLKYYDEHATFPELIGDG